MPIRKPKTKAGKRRVMQEEMHRYKHGELHSGSSRGPKVKSRKQAIAIALKESGQSKSGSSRSKKARDKRLEGQPL